FEELSKYMKFPTDWATRWTQNSPQAFQSNEIIFTFIADVHCYVHSPNLQRLGCIITDSPGLFAGPWDTMVAHEAMLNADAILYLLPGMNAIGMKELGALKEIQKLNQFHKVFFAMNAKDSYEHLRDNIRPTNASIINNCLGQDTITSEAISIFNALLAYNAKHHPYLHEENSLKDWRKETKKTLATFLNLDADEDKRELDEYLANPETISETCKYEELLDIIETTVIQKKACSLLYVNGVLPINTALEKLEGDVLLEEKQALQNAEDAEREVQEAQRVLTSFISESSQIVSNELNDDVVEIISQDYTQKVYKDSIPTIASGIMENVDVMLSDNKESLKYLWSVIKSKAGFGQREEAEFARKIEGYVKTAIQDTCLPATKGWIKNIAQGKNQTSKTVSARLRSIAARIKRAWTNIVLSRSEEIQGYFKGLEIRVDFGGTVEEITETLHGGEFSKSLQGALWNQFISNITANIAGILASTVAFIISGIIIGAILEVAAGGGIIATVAGIISWPLIIAAVAASMAVGLSLADAIKKHFGDKIRTKLSDRLVPDLMRAFESEGVKRHLEESSHEVAQKMLDTYKKYYTDELDNLSTGFRERCDRALCNSRKTKAEQLAVAEHAKKVRKELAKFRAPIVQFIDGVRPYFTDETE
ncbi:MAG: hypothetical protein Q4D38_13995, partial [Planctomycetia bacterium]|nr:hypothetical protein [Planctomycetia bacterium]